MIRWRIVLIGIVLLLADRGRAGPALSRYEVVRIEPVKTSIYVGSVTLSVTPFLRKDHVFQSTYAARVFPYFFYNEQGKISIPIPDEDLEKLSRGETITFAGRGVNDAGDERKIDGKATAAGPHGGRIKVRVYVSKRIALVFNTTYSLMEAPIAQPSAH